MDYILRRSHRRTLSLQVDPTLQVVVRAPLWVAACDVENFVEAHRGWIARQTQRRLDELQAHPPPDEIQREALRRQAQQVIPQRVAYYAGIMGLSPAGIKITSAKTRLGSCSAQNRLCFSLYLMQYPADAIDYIVVHELAHMVHKNHGTEFYALVASILPDYKARRAQLK